jgi:membrane protein DedA with SNARE-associated domain
MLKHLFQPLLDWYQTALESGGYWVVGLLMTCESSVLPLPSESIIPLAASWSHAGKISIGIPGIVLAGALGSWLGATIVYWLARLAGRPLLERYGRFILITPEKSGRAKTGCRITARRACSWRGCCRARGSWWAFPPALRG